MWNNDRKLVCVLIYAEIIVKNIKKHIEILVF